MNDLKTKVTCAIALDELQLAAFRRAINLAIAGKTSINKLDSHGILVPDTSPEIEAKLQEAHRNIRMGHRIQITVTLDPLTGNLSFTL